MTPIKLIRPRHSDVAVQCRQMGIIVGDTIVGRETYGNGDWSEAKLTLLFAGKECAIFRQQRRNNKSPRWRADGESACWTLDHREWRKIPGKIV
jgi:hypothetical protein